MTTEGDPQGGRLNNILHPVTLDAKLYTPEEYTSIQRLRRRYDSGASQFIELDLDERRLEFSRWLVQHGRLSEDI